MQSAAPRERSAWKTSSSNQDAWLQANNVSAAADNVSGRLSQTYPLLSEMAVFRIISQATYGFR